MYQLCIININIFYIKLIKVISREAKVTVIQGRRQYVIRLSSRIKPMDRSSRIYTTRVHEHQMDKSTNNNINIILTNANSRSRRTCINSLLMQNLINGLICSTPPCNLQELGPAECFHTYSLAYWSFHTRVQKSLLVFFIHIHQPT